MINCGAVIDKIKIPAVRENKEDEMIIKERHVTGDQLARLLEFIDTPENVIIMMRIDGEEVGSPITLERAKKRADEIRNGNPGTEVDNDQLCSYRVVKLLDVKVKLEEENVYVQKTSFSVGMVIEEQSPQVGPLYPNPIKTPRELILKVLDILERFPNK